MPLAAQEYALRERLLLAGQRVSPERQGNTACACQPPDSTLARGETILRSARACDPKQDRGFSPLAADGTLLILFDLSTTIDCVTLEI